MQSPVSAHTKLSPQMQYNFVAFDITILMSRMSQHVLLYTIALERALLCLQNFTVRGPGTFGSNFWLRSNGVPVLSPYSTTVGGANYTVVPQTKLDSPYCPPTSVVRISCFCQ